MLIKLFESYLSISLNRSHWTRYISDENGFQLIYVGEKFLIKSSDDLYMTDNFYGVKDIEHASLFYLENGKLKTDDKFVINFDIYFLENSSSPLIEAIKLKDKGKILKFIDEGNIYANHIDDGENSFIDNLFYYFSGINYFEDNTTEDNEFIYEVFRRLIDKNLINIYDLRLSGYSGRTYLHYRAIYENKLFKLLLDNNLIDEELINCKWSNDLTPFEQACMRYDELSKQGVRNFLSTGLISRKQVVKIYTSNNLYDDHEVDLSIKEILKEFLEK